MLDAGKAMLLIAVAALVGAAYMYWKSQQKDVPAADAAKYQRYAMIAAVVAAVAGFLHHRRKVVVSNVASQYLISPNDF